MAKAFCERCNRIRKVGHKHPEDLKKKQDYKGDLKKKSGVKDAGKK